MNQYKYKFLQHNIASSEYGMLPWNPGKAVCVAFVVCPVEESRLQGSILHGWCMHSFSYSALKWSEISLVALNFWWISSCKYHKTNGSYTWEKVFFLFITTKYVFRVGPWWCWFARVISCHVLVRSLPVSTVMALVLILLRDGCPLCVSQSVAGSVPVLLRSLQLLCQLLHSIACD